MNSNSDNSVFNTFPQPPAENVVTLCEQNGQLMTSQTENMAGSKMQGYPVVVISHEHHKSLSGRENAKSAFLPHDETVWKRAMHAWYEMGLSGVFQEVVNSSGEGGEVSSCIFWHPHTVKFAYALQDDSINVHMGKSDLVPVLKHKLQKNVADLSWQVWETTKWSCEVWTKCTGRCKTACWSPDGSILLFATENEPIIYSLSFSTAQDERKAVIGGSHSAIAAVDISEVTLQGADGKDFKTGGLVHSMVWDQTGERLAVLLQDNGGHIKRQIVLFRTKVDLVLEITPWKDVDKGTSSQHIIPDFPLENTDTDKEIRPLVTVSKTNVNDIAKLGSNRFERFSSWMALVRAIARLKHFLSTVFSGTFHGWHSCVDCKSVHSFEEAQKFIIRVVQREVYDSELSCLKENLCVSKTSSILTLNPVLDNDGLLRVGGRLSRADISSNEKNPIIIPGKHYLATLIVRYCHELVFHQRTLRQGAVQQLDFG
ncbi:Aladin [Mytilus edulis]|uniref:Aladin n=1 Tax=Mytilus edulis TaxID=6550 RepID=A0A8S3URZ5_MYTED|nr:Aladin [Mytilus edulis]